MDEYHSFRSKEEDSDSLKYYREGNHVGMIANIEDGMNTFFAPAQFIYSEVPWPYGYRKFMGSAGVEKRWTETPAEEYNRFVSGLGLVLVATKVPTYLLGPLRLMKKLSPDFIHSTHIIHNGVKDTAHLGIWNAPDMHSISDQLELVRNVIYRHGQGPMLDFCSGYFYAHETWLEAGVKTILTDINGKCVAVCREKIREWYASKN